MEFNIKTHNGEITIKNPETGGHRTFKIATQSEHSRFMPNGRIVYRLFGDHDQWVSIGVLTARGIRLWKKFQGSKKMNIYARMLQHPERFPTLEYMFAGTCRVCNRKLTNPESIESGIGAICAQKWGLNRKQKVWTN